MYELYNNHNQYRVGNYYVTVTLQIYLYMLLFACVGVCVSFGCFTRTV